MKYLINKVMYLVVLVILMGCTQSATEEIIDNTEIALTLEEQIMAIPNNSFESTELISLYGEAMKEVLSMAKHSEFRSYIYQSSLEHDKAGGDFDVNFETIVKTHKGSQKFGRSMSKLQDISSKIQSVSSEDRPVVFFPRAETLEDNVKTNKGFDVAKAMNEPIAVMKGAYNDDYSAPGYTLDSNGDLKFVRNVTEEDAWNNDVYIIGKAERVGNLISLCEFAEGGGCYSGGGSTGGGSSSYGNRTNGREEIGGKIQITSNLNEIEHWFSGKLEMRVIVAGIQGSVGTVIVDFPFSKVKRKKFKDKKWYDYKASFFVWNLSNLGDYNIEKWMEIDGGGNTEISISIPGSAYKPAVGDKPAQPAYPGGTVKVDGKRDDDNLGTNIVQFSDKITRTYNLGKMNFKRK